MKVTFKIPSMRIPRELSRMSREEEALLSVLEDTLLARRETVVNLAKKAFDVRFICTGEQFAKFIIARTQRGVANWVKELDAEVVGGSYKPANNQTWVVDSSRGGKPVIRRERDGLYQHQADVVDAFAGFKPDWVAFDEGHMRHSRGHWQTWGTVTGRWPTKEPARNDADAIQAMSRFWRVPAESIVVMNYDDIEKRVLAHLESKQALHDYCVADVNLTRDMRLRAEGVEQGRDAVLKELADAMRARADKQQLKLSDDWHVRHPQVRSHIQSAVKRYLRLEKHFRAMIGGKSFAAVDKEEDIESNKEAAKRRPGQKFTLVVNHVRKVLYYVDATPRVVIKVDGENTFFHENDEALDWSTFRAKWSF